MIKIKINYDEKTGRVIGHGNENLPYIEVPGNETNLRLPDKYSYYAVIDGKYTVAHREPTPEELMQDAQESKAQRLKEIDTWLKANDWKVNKVFLGEWAEDDPRWTEYLETRAALRAEHEILTKEA
jgi:hypothetical protein